MVMQDYIGQTIAASYFRGIESVGGKICFDDNGLNFQSHAMNIQRGDTRIEYSDVACLNKRNTLGFVPNGISILTKDGFEHKFIVNDRNSVLEFLHSKCGI